MWNKKFQYSTMPVEVSLVGNFVKVTAGGISRMYSQKALSEMADWDDHSDFWKMVQKEAERLIKARRASKEV